MVGRHFYFMLLLWTLKDIFYLNIPDICTIEYMHYFLLLFIEGTQLTVLHNYSSIWAQGLFWLCLGTLYGAIEWAWVDVWYARQTILSHILLFWFIFIKAIIIAMPLFSFIKAFRNRFMGRHVAKINS